MANAGKKGDNSTIRVSVGSDEQPKVAQSVLSAARDAAENVRVIEVGPTGVSRLAPLVAVTYDGTTSLWTNPSPEVVREFVESLEDDDLPTDGAQAVVEHDPETSTLPVPESGPLAAGRRRTLGRCGWAAPATLNGDFVAETAREETDATLDRAMETMLLGRGRGDGHTDEPVSEGWRTVRNADGKPVVVINANGSDLMAHGDRTLLEGVPIEILDGALAVADCVEAEDIVVYLNETENLAAQRVQEAVDTIENTGIAKETLIEVVTGPDEYIAGEMTMALESMEGNDRLEARLRPPEPSEFGLYGRPTVIHTPRTLAQVRALLSDPDGFDADATDPGTRLMTVAGDGVSAPTTVELPTESSLAAATNAVGVDGFKMACVGGRFGGVTRSLDIPASAPALAGAHLGTDGVIELFDADNCALKLAGDRAKFARESNCGRCVPCREGAKQLVDLLRDIYDGSYEAGKLRELTRVVRESSICEFGQAAPRPITTVMNEFEREIAAHAEGRCPSGACNQGN